MTEKLSRKLFLNYNPGSNAYYQSNLAGFKDGALSMFLPPWTIIPGTGDESTDDFSDNSFIVYPNPSDGEFSLQFEETREGESITIYDVTGRIVKKQDLFKGQNEYRLDLNSVQSGLYVVSYLRNNGSKETVLIEKL